MDFESEIPFPVRFNPFKHHLKFILNVLRIVSLETIAELSASVCNNYTDIYTGILSPESIVQEVIAILKSRHAILPEDFGKWVTSGNGYQQIKLSDGSEWIVRRGVEDDRYIHLHPARTGLYTFRFKGSSLKTAYLLKAVLRDSGKIPSLENVNRIRKKINLSPVKKLQRNRGILKCVETFFQL